MSCCSLPTRSGGLRGFGSSLGLWERHRERPTLTMLKLEGFWMLSKRFWEDHDGLVNYKEFLRLRCLLLPPRTFRLCQDEFIFVAALEVAEQPILAPQLQRLMPQNEASTRAGTS